MQVIPGLCFSLATFYLPLKNWLNKTRALAPAINKRLKIFLVQDLLTEEFGVNGPVCDAVAKKPCLGAVMSFCSLASASPMETLTFQPLRLVQRRVCFARSLPSSALQCPRQNEIGSQCPLFSNHITSWFLKSWNSCLPFACACSRLCIYCLGFTVLQLFMAASILPVLHVL